MRVYFLCFLSIFIFFQSIFAQTNPPNPDTSSMSGLQNYRTGRDLEGKNRMDDAMEYYNRAVQICVDEISRNIATRDTYAVFTWTLQRQKKYADVITWGQRGLQVYPNDYRVIETMGEAYFYLNQYDRSLVSMQRYVNAFPQGDRASVAYFFIGEIFRIQEKFYHADIAYTAAVQLEPNIPLWWYRLGTVRETLGDFTTAIEAYEQALRLNPEYREALIGLARSRR
ncbi:MAG: tetratricopeptide repeat protein [Treponema sp.]|jgi:tetratricopeptide (TPR) repeat protein|nr:tetratricopeptide repeat protein [Treponema sp.]